MAGKFVLSKAGTKDYRFQLQATNGQVLVTSASYTSRRSALAAIDSVRRHAPQALTVEQPHGG